MKVSRNEIKQIIQEEVTKLLGEMEIPMGIEIETMTDEPASTGPRVTMHDADLPKEIRRLAQEKGMEPQDYLESLGYTPQAASNLLGMASMFDDAKMGMTFSQ